MLDPSLPFIIKSHSLMFLLSCSDFRIYLEVNILLWIWWRNRASAVNFANNGDINSGEANYGNGRGFYNLRMGVDNCRISLSPRKQIRA